MPGTSQIRKILIQSNSFQGTVGRLATTGDNSQFKARIHNTLKQQASAKSRDRPACPICVRRSKNQNRKTRHKARPARSRAEKTHPAVWSADTKAQTEKENKKPHNTLGISRNPVHRLKYANTPARVSGSRQHKIWELTPLRPCKMPLQISYRPGAGIFVQIRHPTQDPTAKLISSATIQSCIEVTRTL